LLKPAASLEADEAELPRLLIEDSELEPMDSDIEMDESENEQACSREMRAAVRVKRK